MNQRMTALAVALLLSAAPIGLYAALADVGVDNPLAAVAAPVQADCSAEPADILVAFDEFTHQHARWRSDDYQRGDATPYPGEHCQHVAEIIALCRAWDASPDRALRYEAKRVQAEHAQTCPTL